MSQFEARSQNIAYSPVVTDTREQSKQTFNRINGDGSDDQLYDEQEKGIISEGDHETEEGNFRESVSIQPQKKNRLVFTFLALVVLLVASASIYLVFDHTREISMESYRSDEEPLTLLVEKDRIKGTSEESLDAATFSPIMINVHSAADYSDLSKLSLELGEEEQKPNKEEERIIEGINPNDENLKRNENNLVVLGENDALKQEWVKSGVKNLETNELVQDINQNKISSPSEEDSLLESNVIHIENDQNESIPTQIDRVKEINGEEDASVKEESEEATDNQINNNVVMTNTKSIERNAFVKNLVFVKQTKVGGTTLKLVLQHLAKRHNLVIGSGKTTRKKSVNISAHHRSFQDILKDDIVKDPKRYIWFYREPTSKAASLFYWKHQEKIPATTNPEWKKLTLEDPSNISSEHADLLALWTKQDRKTKQDLNEFAAKYNYNDKEKNIIKNMVQYRTQYSWIAKTPAEAIKAVKAYDMLVGKTEDMDGSLMLFRKVLGWTLQDILYVNSNYYKHMKFSDWSPQEQNNMNQTLQENGEWYFYNELNEMWDYQIEELYGGESLFEEDKNDFKIIRTSLLDSCAGGKKNAQIEAINQGCKKSCDLYEEEYQCMISKYNYCIANENTEEEYCQAVNGALKRLREL